MLDLSEMTHEQLKQKCIALSVPVYGTKNEMKKRIQKKLKEIQEEPDKPIARKPATKRAKPQPMIGSLRMITN